LSGIRQYNYDRIAEQIADIQIDNNGISLNQALLILFPEKSHGQRKGIAKALRERRKRLQKSVGNSNTHEEKTIMAILMDASRPLELSEISNMINQTENQTRAILSSLINKNTVSVDGDHKYFKSDIDMLNEMVTKKRSKSTNSKSGKTITADMKAFVDFNGEDVPLLSSDPPTQDDLLELYGLSPDEWDVKEFTNGFHDNPMKIRDLITVNDSGKEQFFIIHKPILCRNYKATLKTRPVSFNIEKFYKNIKLYSHKQTNLEEALKLDKKVINYNCGTILSQDTVGARPVYDIEVDNDSHMFLTANGVIVHNSEPLAQAALNTKHQGGAHSGDKKAYAGLSFIEQVLQSPESYPEKAAVSELAGTVTSVEEAPQGGTYITIDDTKHYVLPQYKATVKVGDEVEAGHQISEGLIDIDDIVATRGLGEGRKAFVSTLGQVLADSGIAAHKRNLETFARSAVNHIQINDLDGSGDYLPDDVAYYSDYVNSYVPSKEAKMRSVDSAVGKYLEEPALHYTIGTKLTPSMIKDIQNAEIDKVYTSDTEPAFSPILKRLTAAKHDDPDWLVRMSTSYLKANLSAAAASGLDTNTKNTTHYAPALAGNTPEFGKTITSTGKF